MNRFTRRLRRLFRPDGLLPDWESGDGLAFLRHLHRRQMLGAWPTAIPGQAANQALVRRQTSARNLKLQHLLDELERLLPFPVIVLKGGAFLFDLYAGDWGARHVYDLDLLVAPGRKAELLELLRARGWQTLAGYPDYWFNPADGETVIPVDVHTELLCAERLPARRAILTATDERRLLADPVPLPGHRRLQGLAPVSSGFLLLLHHLHHHDFGSWKWWYDFHRWRQRYPERVTELWATAPVGARPAVAFGLWFHARLASMPLPPEVAAPVARARRWYWEPVYRRFLADQPVDGLRYGLAVAGTPPGTWPAALRAALLPPRASLRHFYFRSGPVTSPLYRHHWRQLAARSLAAARALAGRR